MTPAIAAEITVLDEDGTTDVRRALVGEDQVQVFIGQTGSDNPRPVAILITDWIREHLSRYARELWHRPR